MEATSRQLESDVLIISEHKLTKLEEEGGFYDLSGKATIAVFNSRLQIEKKGPKNNEEFRWIQISNLTIYACYRSPNTELTLFLDFPDKLE